MKGNIFDEISQIHQTKVPWFHEYEEQIHGAVVEPAGTGAEVGGACRYWALRLVEKGAFKCMVIGKAVYTELGDTFQPFADRDIQITFELRCFQVVGYFLSLYHYNYVIILWCLKLRISFVSINVTWWLTRILLLTNNTFKSSYMNSKWHQCTRNLKQLRGINIGTDNMEEDRI